MVKVNEKVVLELIGLLVACVGTYQAVTVAKINKEVKLAEISKDITLAKITSEKEVTLAQISANEDNQ